MKNIYFDQATISNIGNNPELSWKETDLGRLIFKAQQERKLSTWASPTHALETLLFCDYDDNFNIKDTYKLDQRKSIASSLLEMVDGKRMLSSYEFMIIKELITRLESILPGSIIDKSHFNLMMEESQRTYLCAIALLGCLRNLDRPELIQQLWRSKLTSQLLHAQFAYNPEGFLKKIISSADNFPTIIEYPFKEIDQMSLKQIRSEIEKLKSQAKKFEGSQLSKFKRYKDRICHVYAAAEVWPCINAIFRRPIDLLLTFNIPLIVGKWSTIMSALGTSVALDEDIAKVNESQITGNIDIATRAIQKLIFSFKQNSLSTSGVIYRVIFNVLQVSLNQGKLPTAGLTFDADHAVALCYCNIF